MNDSFSQGGVSPSIPKGFNSPFVYYSMQNIAVYYLVDKAKVEEVIIDRPELTTTIFGGEKALFSFNFQRYYAPLGEFSAITQELEVNVLVFPTNQKQALERVTPEQFLLGKDTTRLFGDYHLFVPCDAPVAIQAGKEMFGEPKILCGFDATLPDFNDPDVRTWQFATYAGDQSGSAKLNSKDLIFNCTVDTTGLTAQPGNLSPISLYGYREGRLIGTRWNLYEVMPTYFLTDEQAEKAVSLNYGQSDLSKRHTDPQYEAMLQTMKVMTQGQLPFAIREFNSPPCATVAPPYYV